MWVTDKLESLGKVGTAALPVSVALVYLFGYLSLRVRLNVLGIPGDINAFDERYLYAGASFVVSTALVFYQLTVIAVPFLLGVAIAVGIAVWLGLHTRRGDGAIRVYAEHWRGRLGIASVAAVIFFASISVRRAEPWWSGNPLFFETSLSPCVGVIATDNWVLAYMVSVLLTCGTALLAAVASWGRMSRALMTVVYLALGIQLLSLPMLFGALTADQPWPKVTTGDGQAGWLVWEDAESLTYFQEAPSARLVRLRKSDAGTITVLGYERILRRRWQAKGDHHVDLPEVKSCERY
jgi:hypothetical protein